MLLGSKAETIKALHGKLNNGDTLPAVAFNVSTWTTSKRSVIEKVMDDHTLTATVIVRSSFADEDGEAASHAGRFLSVPAARSEKTVEEAIERVIASYGRRSGDDYVLIQPFLLNAAASGVAFNRDPKTGSPYDVVNYSLGSDTSVVTAGTEGRIETYTANRRWTGPRPEPVGKVVALLRELEGLFGDIPLDVEFAVSQDGRVILLQVRRLVCAAAPTVDDTHHWGLLHEVQGALRGLLGPSRSMVAARSLLGVMPDWNPAEMIGTRPRPLAMSLYRFLITDSVWARQRRRYGYRDVRDTPLMVDIYGLPYIDIRASFNSFVPASLPDDVASRLVESCISRLSLYPHLHDKVEFEVIPSCYTFDITERLDLLCELQESDKNLIVASLRNLTKSFLSGDHLRKVHKDEGEIWRLDHLQSLEDVGSLPNVFDLHRILVQCRRHGTLPFAGLARAAFVAIDLLRSAVHRGILSPDDAERIMMGLKTPTARMMADASMLDRETFLARYGHLRPGTYDIRVPSYAEDPDLYLGAIQSRCDDADARTAVAEAGLPACVINGLDRALLDHGLDCSAKSFQRFVELSVVGREDAKFVFTRSVSRILGMIAALGAEHGFTREDMSYVDVRSLLDLRVTHTGIKEALRRSMENGRERYASTNALTLPPLIRFPDEAFAFHVPVSQPNFVTRRIAEGPVRTVGDRDLSGAIVFIANADPGYDWIFSKGIAGLVTAYGGKNSHMAIRAAELGLPAVIGAGEPLFEKWRRAGYLRLDCGSERVETIG